MRQPTAGIRERAPVVSCSRTALPGAVLPYGTHRAAMLMGVP